MKRRVLMAVLFAIIVVTFGIAVTRLDSFFAYQNAQDAAAEADRP